ncbi:unnamed protein product [Dibothriocephalus latus]|uniref:Uncharacterized protein n=1 Tax=Dibothriocephalus latus TaxID=60516 RepID=A0A3P7L7M6_DIBLA|nr:unnamed protein product [Dibothriocephalus latus]
MRPYFHLDDKPAEVDLATTPTEATPEPHEGDTKEALDTKPLAKALDEVECQQGKEDFPEEHEAAKVAEDASPKEGEKPQGDKKEDSGADVNSETVEKEQGTKEEKKEEQEDKSEAKPEEA